MLLALLLIDGFTRLKVSYINAMFVGCFSSVFRVLCNFWYEWVASHSDYPPCVYGPTSTFDTSAGMGHVSISSIRLFQGTYVVDATDREARNIFTRSRAHPQYRQRFRFRFRCVYVNRQRRIRMHSLTIHKTKNAQEIQANDSLNTGYEMLRQHDV